MRTLLDTPTYVEHNERSPWRLHDNYLAPSSARIQDTENSTEPPISGEPVELSSELTATIAQAIQTTAGPSELYRLYTELVRGISEVRFVVASRDGDAVHIITVIEAPPFERTTRNKVYAAQQAVLERVVNCSVEFRLINTRELQEDIYTIIPTDATRLYVRM